MVSVGARLREIREGKKLSLNTVAKSLNISIKYLESIENDDFSSMPGRAYTIGYIRSYSNYLNALKMIEEQVGSFLVPGGVLSGEGFDSGCYVKPVIVEIDHSKKIVQEETFAPILYLIKYSGDVESAIEIQNEVKQGLSSAIMTK